MKEFGFPKTSRLLKSREFQRVFAGKAYAADNTLVINARPNDVGHLRLGLSIGRKVGNAVVRNRWKRLIREAFRVEPNRSSLGLDIVVRPRKNAVCDGVAVRRSIGKLIHRAAKKTGPP